jgi:hypothetical protein
VGMKRLEEEGHQVTSNPMQSVFVMSVPTVVHL